MLFLYVGLVESETRSGRELIKNAQITATTRKITYTEQDIAAFKERFGVLPGDIPNPEEKIPACKQEIKCGKGNGDSKIGGLVGEYIESENEFFWQHLVASGDISHPEYYPDGNWNMSGFESPLFIGYFDGKSSLPDVLGETKEGHYFFLTSTSGKVAFLKTQQAAMLDRKMDDGMPMTGKVIAAGNPNCLSKKMNRASPYITKNSKNPAYPFTFIWDIL